MAMKVIGINESYTMSMPLQVLNSFAADFDGDTLNIDYIPLAEFWDKALEIFNPRDAMMISRNDGTFNNDMNVFKDILINSNAFIGLGRSNYFREQLAKIKAIKERNKMS